MVDPQHICSHKSQEKDGSLVNQHDAYRRDQVATGLNIVIADVKADHDVGTEQHANADDDKYVVQHAHAACSVVDPVAQVLEHHEAEDNHHHVVDEHHCYSDSHGKASTACDHIIGQVLSVNVGLDIGRLVLVKKAFGCYGFSH